MADIATIMQVIAKVAVEVDKTLMLAINGEDRRQSINAKHSGAQEITRHKTGPSLRQLVFLWKVKYTSSGFLKWR